MPSALTTAPAAQPSAISSMRLLMQQVRSLVEDVAETDEVDESDPDEEDASASDSTSASTPSGGAATAVHGGVYALVKPLENGDVELRAFRTGRSKNFCFRAPVVVSKSAKANVNANASGCPTKWTHLSCSCVQVPSSTWELKIAKLSSASSTSNSSSAAVASDSALAVSSIGIFMLPSTVASLKLVGDSTDGEPVDVELRLLYETNNVVASAPQLVAIDDKSVLTTVEVSNINLASVDITSEFLPPSLVKISLQKCNLASLASDFLAKRHGNLQTLDLSGNQLNMFNAGVATEEKSTIKTLDLSSNNFTSIPSSLVSLVRLEQLNLRGNPIANWSVTKDQFSQLSSLSAFEIDASSSEDRSADESSAAIECNGGSVQSIGVTKFCVLTADTLAVSRDSQSAAPTPSNSVTTSSSDSSSSALYFGAGIPIVLIVLGLIAFVVRKKWRPSSSSEPTDKPDSFDISLLECTDSHNSSMITVNESLLHDPVIVTHRIPYKDVKVGECVSQGGFGVVYAGVYKRRRVAIKKIHVGQNREVLRVESFLREIGLMASLEHPRIVEFIGVAWDSLRNLSAVTEFMERGDLRDVLQGFKKRGRSMTWDAHKLRIALHIAEALTYLHSLDPVVIHRDLKSKNVLLDSDLNAKLGDFGISREWTEDMTSMTVGIGTSFWIAPEVLLGKQYDQRADVFSFGVVLSELDTDDYPYWNVPGGVQDKENEILRMVAADAIRPKFTDECPKEIALLADHCLQGDPMKRPTSAQIVQFLQRLLVTGTHSSSSSSLSLESSLASPVSEDSFFHGTI